MINAHAATEKRHLPLFACRRIGPVVVVIELPIAASSRETDDR
jgi:hypothetical protein